MRIPSGAWFVPMPQACMSSRLTKPRPLRIIQAHLKVKEADIQEDTYNQFRQYLDYPPNVSRKGMEAVLAELGDKDPAAKAAKPDDFIDMRFVAELEREGFFKKFAIK